MLGYVIHGRVAKMHTARHVQDGRKAKQPRNARETGIFEQRSWTPDVQAAHRSARRVCVPGVLSERLHVFVHVGLSREHRIRQSWDSRKVDVLEAAACLEQTCERQCGQTGRTSEIERHDVGKRGRDGAADCVSDRTDVERCDHYEPRALFDQPRDPACGQVGAVGNIHVFQHHARLREPGQAVVVEIGTTRNIDRAQAAADVEGTVVVRVGGHAKHVSANPIRVVSAFE